MGLYRDKEQLSGGITPELLKSCISEFMQKQTRLSELSDYYDGKHRILTRLRSGSYAPDNRLVNGFPKYISDTAVGYMFGNPVGYMSDEDISGITDAFKAAETDTHDAELGKDLSVFGTGYELIYMSDDENPVPQIALVDPLSAFVVYDRTVTRKPLFGCTVFPRYSTKGITGYTVNVYTDRERMKFTTRSLSHFAEPPEVTSHFFSEVPLVKYVNNEQMTGDFEGVISLIDAYDTLQSDRVNDKERFVNAMLLIKNAQLPDDAAETARMLKNGILELPGDNADASYLTKTLNEQETEILKRAIESDIHKFSMTPDFTDEQFAGNTSGVAIRYKLLSLEYLAKIKERFFSAGLRRRLVLFNNILAVKGRRPIDISKIQITFNRTLPINEAENAETLSGLVSAGLMSKATAMANIGLVRDTEAEMARLINERAGD